MLRRIAHFEHSAQVLTVVKLANVALSMIWGFAVTYIFVRLLPQADFRTFLLMMAFNNFVSSTEFGLTNIIYARLRHFWLGDGAEEASDFRREEIGALFMALLALVLGSTALVAFAFVSGLAPTGYPAALVLFFLSSALSLQVLIVKRILAAIDLNLLWEAVDLVRRIISLAALFAVLVGFDLLTSAIIQLVVTVVPILWAMLLVHRKLGMRVGQWTALRVGGNHMRRTYLGRIGGSVAFTLCEIVAYNAPYFLISALGGGWRLLLLFDFLFKMMRAVSFAIRATIEAALPRLTRFRFAGDAVAFRRGLMNSGGTALAVSLCASLLLLAIGDKVFAALFDGKAQVTTLEMALIAASLMALALICTSVYVQGSLGRYPEMLVQSVPFMLGSLALMPLTLVVAGSGEHMAVGNSYLALNAGLFGIIALLHVVSLRRLAGSVGKGGLA